MIGANIAHYRITAKLGEGGMGAVYRATDTKLARDVAIKVLPDEFATDPNRLSRFVREAQVLASLNHPNIATIHGLEGTAIVMELVEGPTLADRIAQGAMPLNEALAIARQIAEALEAAHERGIIHRDFKPANVKVTPEGKVKVLDFGLAKLSDTTDPAENPSSAPTRVRGQSPTMAGMIMGTAGYMSPEQARGLRVDARADIWAFGVVLFEMLSGKELFAGGETVTDMIAAVVTRDPDWKLLPVATPLSIRRLLRRALERDRRNRLGSMADARLEIDEALQGTPETPLKGAGAPPIRSNRFLGLAGAALVAVLALGWAAGHWMRPAPTPPSMAKFQIQSHDGAAFAHIPAVSPDGRRIAAVVHLKDRRHGIVLRSLDTLDAQMVTGSDNSREPFWSPDSRSLAFFAETPLKLKRMELGGGPAVTLCELAKAGSSVSVVGTWSRDGLIVFSVNEELYRVPASGGLPSKLPTSPGLNRSHPQFLPDGKHYLFLGTAEGKTGVWVGSLSSVDATKLVDSSGQGVFAPSAESPTRGYLLYTREQTLMAHSFDAARFQLQGDPFPIAEQVGRWPQGLAFSAAGTGTLAFLTGSYFFVNELLRFDRSGRSETVSEPGTYGEISRSPDGKRVALAEGNIATNSGRELWLLDLGRNLRTRFTFHPGNDTHPVWSPDGSRIAYGAERGGPVDLYVKASGGGEAERALLKTKSRKFPTDWSRDGRFLLYNENDDIWVLPMTAEPKPSIYLQSEFSEAHAKFSPDGKYVVYQSNESGPVQIYVRPFPDSAKGKWQVSSAGGAQPVWSADGKEVYYVDPNGKLMAASLKLGPPGAPAVQVDTPHALFDSRVYGNLISNSQKFTTLPDAGFLVIANGERSDALPLTVVLNWK